MLVDSKEGSRATTMPDEIQSPLSTLLSDISFSPNIPPPPIHNVIKRRRRLNMNEQSILQRVFDACSKPSAAIRDKLADRLGMSRRCIQIWFQNRRAKFKRDQMEARQPALLFKATIQLDDENAPESDSFDEKQLEDLLSSCATLTSTSFSSPDDSDINHSSAGADWLPFDVPDDSPDSYDSLIINPSVLEANIIALEKQNQFDPFMGEVVSTSDNLFDLYLAV